MSDEPEDKPDCCDCCYFDTPELVKYQRHDDMPPKWLCDLCASSLAGNYVQYSKLYSGSNLPEIAGLIMNAANHIIAEIRKREKSRSGVSQ